MKLQDPAKNPIFVTGASGYVGGRLVPALLPVVQTLRLRERPVFDDGLERLPTPCPSVRKCK